MSHLSAWSSGGARVAWRHDRVREEIGEAKGVKKPGNREMSKMFCICLQC